MATSVAVSKASTSIRRCLVAAPSRATSTIRRRSSRVLQRHGDSCSRKSDRSGLRPLDEDDRVVEVRLEVAPLGGRHLHEPVEVEVRDVDDSSVAMPDRERRARHRRGYTERAAGSPYEGGLPGPSSPETVTTSPTGSAPRAARPLGLARRGAGELDVHVRTGRAGSTRVEASSSTTVGSPGPPRRPCAPAAPECARSPPRAP